MPTTISNILPIVRNRLIEPSPNYWSDDELTEICISGIRDLWRDIVDLKQEHYLTINNQDVVLPAGTANLIGVPADVHKIYMIEPRDLTVNGANHGLLFKPLDYNDNTFQLARSREDIDPANDTIYYAVQGQGAPVNSPVIKIAPKTTSQVLVSFCYVPSLGNLDENSIVPIPGEADNALIAWTVAFARAKEREDRSPDEAWLSIYATEKSHLLQSLGLRDYQEPEYTHAVWEEYW